MQYMVNLMFLGMTIRKERRYLLAAEKQHENIIRLRPYKYIEITLRDVSYVALTLQIENSSDFRHMSSVCVDLPLLSDQLPWVFLKIG